MLPHPMQIFPREIKLQINKIFTPHKILWSYVDKWCGCVSKSSLREIHVFEVRQKTKSKGLITIPQTKTRPFYYSRKRTVMTNVKKTCAVLFADVHITKTVKTTLLSFKGGRILLSYQSFYRNGHLLFTARISTTWM